MILKWLQQAVTPILAVAILVLIYWWAGPLWSIPTPHEILSVETAREAFYGHWQFYPSFNFQVLIPQNPLFTLILGLIFKIAPATLFTARLLTLILGLVSLGVVSLLAGRMFQPWAGGLAAAFMAATWGFFSTSHTANGAMLYIVTVLALLFLFYDWFDNAFRSRTLARSLYTHFIGIGVLLALCFWMFGIPGVLYPLLVMTGCIFLSDRWELVMDMDYRWMLAPLGGLLLLWLIFLPVSVGFWPFLGTLFPFQFSFTGFILPLLYALPILPLIIPALSNKDILSRAFLSHQRALLLIMVWLVVSMIFSGLFATMGEAFALLGIVPVLSWLGYYLSEVYRNPVIPKPLQWTMDGMVAIIFFTGVAVAILTFQLAPHELFKPFVMLSASLIVMAIALLLLRELTISRSMPFYIVPTALLFCMLTRNSLEPMFLFQPEWQLLQSPLIQEKLASTPKASVIVWHPHPEQPAIGRLLTPLQTQVFAVSKRSELEARIQTREGLLYLVLPESNYYNLPESVKSIGKELATSWRWNRPMTFSTVLFALQNEMADFDSLSHPAFLIEIEPPDPQEEDLATPTKAVPKKEKAQH